MVNSSGWFGAARNPTWNSASAESALSPYESRIRADREVRLGQTGGQPHRALGFAAN